MPPGQPWLFPGYRGRHMSARQLHRLVRTGGGTRRHYQARRRSYAAAQLCHPSLGAKDRYPRHPGPPAVLLGHKKLDTTALYTRVAISAIGEVTSPLDFLLKMPG